MALIDPLHPIQSHIIQYLSTHPGASFHEIQSHLTLEHFPLSRSQIYRTLNALLDALILYRSHEQYYLNAVWLENLKAFTDSIPLNTIPLHFPQEEGERLAYSGKSLTDLDPVWTHLMVELTKHVKPDILYFYTSHPYYQLGMHTSGTSMYHAITRHDAQLHFLFGHDSFLDKKGMSVLSKDPTVRVAYDIHPPFPNKGYIVNVIGNTIFEVFLPHTIHHQFEYFFTHVQNEEQYDPEMFRAIFHTQEKCTLTVRKNTKDAELIRKSMDGYFSS